MEEILTRVYIQTDYLGNITNVYSSDFSDFNFGGIMVAEGIGDKYRHAQTQFFEKPLINEYGQYNYMYINGEIIDRGI